MTSAGFWSRLQEQFGIVSMRPRLAPDVKLRHIGDEFELFQSGTRRVVPLSVDEAEAIRRFDGERSVAQIVVATMEEGALEVEPVLSLVDRLVRAEMLDDYPPHLYRQLEVHLERLGAGGSPHPPGRPVASEGDESGSGAGDEEQAADEPPTDADATPGDPRRDPDGPWRPRSPAIADRARFLRDVSLFASLDLRSIGALADTAHEERWPPQSFIISEGARADRFFLLRSGEVTVERREQDGGFEGLATLGPGDWFGEAALLESAPRNATVRAGEREVHVYSFDADVFDRWIRPHVVAAGGSELVSRRRAQLEQVPVFRALAVQDLDRLARVLREEEAAPGSILFRQGDPADSFYVIIEGSVGVVKDGKPIAKLVAGEFFGETALLFTDARTATIAATEPSRFWVLDRDSFETFLRDALLQRRDLMPTVLNRIASTDPV